MKTIKKFGILLLTVLIVACSDDDSNGDAPDVPSSTYSISVTASSNNDYTLVGTDANGEVNGNDPSITMSVGETISFSVNAASHPFYIKTSQTTGTGDAYTDGVGGNGSVDSKITFTVPMDAPDTLYYICEFHSSMTGTFTIID